MGLAATTEQALGELFESTIVSMAPRLQYKGAQGWKPHKRETSIPTSTRRFRQIWTAGTVQPRGAMSGSKFEHTATLRIRTEYAGAHEHLQFIVIDDHHQLRDTLSALKSSDDNGLVMLVSAGSPELVTGTESSDVVTYDHVFTVRFMRTIAP
jgi:hypothetical protein